MLPNQLLFIIIITLLSKLNASFSFCPAGCTCNDDTLVVQCEKSKLDVIPIALNPSIQRLVLRNNKIHTIDSAFQFYGELQYADLSCNHLVSIPNNSFFNQKKLAEFHLNKNKLSSITNITFQGLKSLTILNLRENFLEELAKGVFSVLPKLEELNLGQNRISFIDPHAFDGLSSLRVLYLDDNQLNVVPTDSFKPLGSLAELHIGYNVFTILNVDSFKGLQKLAVLDLGGSGLINITDGAFNGLTTLRSLILVDNKLSVIPTRQLSELTRLEELTIGQNDFITLSESSFKGLTYLKHLDISGAIAFESIQNGAFSSNLNLESVTLVSNKHLSEIEDGALAGLPKLRKLILRNNNFEYLSEASVTWSELKVLDLSENPLQCNCRLLWLRALLISRNLSNAQCAGPPFVKDKQLRNVQLEELGCALQDRRQQAVLGAICVIVVALLTVLAIILYRHRNSLRDTLKNWNTQRTVSGKEHEYQKTFSEDEYLNRQSNMYSHHHIPCAPPPLPQSHAGVHYNHANTEPTTEL